MCVCANRNHGHFFWMQKREGINYPSYEKLLTFSFHKGHSDYLLHSNIAIYTKIKLALAKLGVGEVTHCFTIKQRSTGSQRDDGSLDYCKATFD